MRSCFQSPSTFVFSAAVWFEGFKQFAIKPGQLLASPPKKPASTLGAASRRWTGTCSLGFASRLINSPRTRTSACIKLLSAHRPTSALKTSLTKLARSFRPQTI